MLQLTNTGSVQPAAVSTVQLCVCCVSAKFKLHYGDMTDSSCLVKIIADVRPTEIYNLAAQSHVKVCACISINDCRPPTYP